MSISVELKKYIDKDLQELQFDARYVTNDEQKYIKEKVESHKLIPQFWWGRCF